MRGDSTIAMAIGLAVLLVGIGHASGSTDTTDARVARCTAGAVEARIAGKRVCLRRGQRCTKRLDRQYHRYGLHCHSGRLTGGPEPAPPLPAAGKVVATIPVPSTGGIAIGAGAVWVANNGPHTVTRLDPRTNAATATIEIGDPTIDPLHGPTYLAFSHGSLWVLDGTANCGCVHRIDPETNRIVATTR